ncbi:MAG: PQQ-dependent sugar dehydrogenase, partial [Thermoproteota archaeon]|nr:PQQ-dependent sugar dehydrogenase [Thermoproteota archaeon]
FLGSNDILVIEKNTGNVLRILDGVLQPDPLLKLKVANQVERGLLGIAVSNDSSLGKNYVFLYYTEAKSETGEGQEEDDDNNNYEENEEGSADLEGGEPAGNRLYRYELSEDGTKLVNPKLLLDLPYLPGPAHNGGVITIGPDDNLYIVVGNLLANAEERFEGSSLDQNIQNGDFPDGRGGILRVTQDGQIVDGKGILGDEHPLDMYYAYGIRNSFGLAFDPLTGKLWDTENGPNWGDELNLVEPGFNSGWAKVLGNWTVDEVINEEGDREINKGESLGSGPDGLIDFNGKGRYSSPELTWDETIAPTAITFLNSDKLGKQYENDMFIGTVKDRLLHFKLEEPNRTELSLNGTLDDKVAGTVQDIEDVTFAEGFGIVTDVKVGPDGYLYIVSGARSADGKIYRVLPSTAG